MLLRTVIHCLTSSTLIDTFGPTDRTRGSRLHQKGSKLFIIILMADFSSGKETINKLIAAYILLVVYGFSPSCKEKNQLAQEFCRGCLALKAEENNEEISNQLNSALDAILSSQDHTASLYLISLINFFHFCTFRTSCIN